MYQGVGVVSIIRNKNQIRHGRARNRTGLGYLVRTDIIIIYQLEYRVSFVYIYRVIYSYSYIYISTPSFVNETCIMFSQSTVPLQRTP